MNIEQINIEQIRFSNLNPRKIVDLDSVIELSESIKSVGLLQPVTVRSIPNTDKYELIMGSRRLRACKSIGMTTIPSIVTVMNDDEVLEAMIIENLQRKDIEPLDEARAFLQLSLKGYSDEAIAAKVGKSKSFVVLRLKLNNLCIRFQEMLNAKTLPLLMAYEFCKFDTSIQDDIYSKHFAPEIDESENWLNHSIQSIRTLLSSNLIPLSIGDFDKTECSTCIHNSRVTGSLFAEYSGDNCSNSICFQNKKREHVVAVIKDCLEQDIPVMIPVGRMRIEQQLKELGVENILYYEDGKYDIITYPSPLPITNDDFENEANARFYEKQLLDFDDACTKKGYYKAYTAGMIKEGIKYVYYAEKEVIVDKSGPIAPVEDTKESEIEKLNKRDARNLEIKQEKILVEAKEVFRNSDYPNMDIPSMTENEDYVFIALILNATSTVDVMSLKGSLDKSKSLIQNVKSLSPAEISFIKRSYIRQTLLGYAGSNDKDVHGVLIEHLNEICPNELNAVYEKYDEIYQKKRERIVTRLKVIQNERENENETTEIVKAKKKSSKNTKSNKNDE